MTTIFDSSSRQNGDLAGVFEYDGETGYFYFYQMGSNGNKILAAIHVISGFINLTASEIEIRWDRENRRVGLFIRGELWAIFDAQDSTKYGGDYVVGKRPQLPAHLVTGFGAVS